MVTGLSWRDDANVLASCSEDGSVRLWEMENGKQIKSWGAQPGGALSVHFGHDNQIVTTGRDGTTHVWDGNGSRKRTFEKLTDLTTQAAFTHDGKRVIAGDWRGLIRIWTAADGKRVDDLSTNPPSAADRLLAAKKALPEAEAALIAKEAALVKAKLAHDSARAAATKVEQELAPLRKAAADSANIAKVVAGAAADAQAAAERANGALASAQASVQAREIRAAIFAEAAAKIKDAANKAAANGELKLAVEQAQQLAVQTAAERDAARKSLTDATAAGRIAADHLAAAKKAAADSAGPAHVASKALAAKQQAAKAATDTAAQTQKAIDRLTAEAVTLRTAVEGLRARVASAK